MTIQEKTVQMLSRTWDSTLRTYLNSLAFVDIGFIESIDKNNRATVVVNRFTKSKSQIVYRDVEVVYPGNGRGAFGYGTGSMCLLFNPVTSIEDTRTGETPLHNQPYSGAGRKALPISNGAGANVFCGFNLDGSFYLHSPECNATFTQDTVSLFKEGVFNIEVKNDGSISEWLGSGLQQKLLSADGSVLQLTLDANGKYRRMVIYQTDGTFIKYNNTYEDPEADADITEFDKWVWCEQLNPDNSRLISMNSSNGEELTLNITADGDVSVTTKHNVTIEQQDSNGNTQFSFSVNDSGTMSVNVKGDVNFTSDSDISIDAGSNNVTISSAKCTINNNLEVS